MRLLVPQSFTARFAAFAERWIRPDEASAEARTTCPAVPDSWNMRRCSAMFRGPGPVAGSPGKPAVQRRLQCCVEALPLRACLRLRFVFTENRSWHLPHEASNPKHCCPTSGNSRNMQYLKFTCILIFYWDARTRLKRHCNVRPTA